MKTDKLTNAEKCSIYYYTNKEERLQKQREYYYRKREERLQYAQANKDRRKEYMSEYQKEKKHVVNAINSKRRAKKLQATPQWLTTNDLDQIREFYFLAKTASEVFGVKCHVDHIIPLQGKEVCGLHVPWNLQVLEASANISKGNKMKIRYEDANV